MDRLTGILHQRRRERFAQKLEERRREINREVERRTREWSRSEERSRSFQSGLGQARSFAGADKTEQQASPEFYKAVLYQPLVAEHEIEAKRDEFHEEVMREAAEAVTREIEDEEKNLAAGKSYGGRPSATGRASWQVSNEEAKTSGRPSVTMRYSEGAASSQLRWQAELSEVGNSFKSDE